MSATICTDPEGVRPDWTFNNPGLFLHWMKTGATEKPQNWQDPEDETNFTGGADS